MPATPKTAPGRRRGRPATGRVRERICVSLSPAAHAALERLRTTPRGKLGASAVIEGLLLAAR